MKPCDWLNDGTEYRDLMMDVKWSPVIGWIMVELQRRIPVSYSRTENHYHRLGRRTTEIYPWPALLGWACTKGGICQPIAGPHIQAPVFVGQSQDRILQPQSSDHDRVTWSRCAMFTQTVRHVFCLNLQLLRTPWALWLAGPCLSANHRTVYYNPSHPTTTESRDLNAQCL